MVQRLEGRPDRNAPGDGHCDAVLAVDAHPKLSVIASGALEKDCTVKLWADSSDPSVSARPGMFDAAIRNAAADAAAAASAQLPPAAPTAAPEQACTLSASAGDEHLSFVACIDLLGIRHHNSIRSKLFFLHQISVLRGKYSLCPYCLMCHLNKHVRAIGSI